MRSILPRSCRLLYPLEYCRFRTTDRPLMRWPCTHGTEAPFFAQPICLFGRHSGSAVKRLDLLRYFSSHRLADLGSAFLASHKAPSGFE